MEKDKKESVRKEYGEIAKNSGFCCGSCSCVDLQSGYDSSQLQSVPGEADLGLGCGNPTAPAELKVARPCWTWVRAPASIASWPRAKSGIKGVSSAWT